MIYKIFRKDAQLSTSAITVPKQGVLADIFSDSLVKNIALVVGYAGFIGLFAQISFHLSFTPVPITGQTFAVLLGAASIGWARASLGSLLYAVAGVAGVPWFAGGTSGWHVAVGASFGYIVSYLLCSAAVGLLAKKGLDRNFFGTAFIMAIGTIIIYAIGVTWLAFDIHVSAGKAIALGMTPFLPGDLFKLILAAIILPVTWQAVKRFAD